MAKPQNHDSWFQMRGQKTQETQNEILLDLLSQKKKRNRTKLFDRTKHTRVKALISYSTSTSYRTQYILF